MQRGSVSLPSRPPNDMGIGETLYAYVHIRRIWSPHFCITKIKPGRNVCTNFHVDLHVHNCFVNGRVVPYNGKFVTFRKNENFYHFNASHCYFPNVISLWITFYHLQTRFDNDLGASRIGMTTFSWIRSWVSVYYVKLCNDVLF